MSEYKICKRCIMDTTSDPNLILDENGVCNYCHDYDNIVKKMEYQKRQGTKYLETIFNKMKEEGNGKEND